MCVWWGFGDCGPLLPGIPAQEAGVVTRPQIPKTTETELEARAVPGAKPASCKSHHRQVHAAPDPPRGAAHACPSIPRASSAPPRGAAHARPGDPHASSLGEAVGVRSGTAERGPSLLPGAACRGRHGSRCGCGCRGDGEGERNYGGSAHVQPGGERSRGRGTCEEAGGRVGHARGRQRVRECGRERGGEGRRVARSCWGRGGVRASGAGV